MKKTLFRTAFVLVGVFCLFGSADAATTVNGTLPGSATWTKAGSPYIATGVLVPSGATLTIEPGTIVKLRGTQALFASGTINIGGEGEPVIITTQKDDSFGGDTNNDGSATNPSKIDWCYIGVGASATLNVRNTHIYYGGCTPVYGQLYNLGGALTIEDSLLTKSGQFGLLAASGTSTIRNTEVTDNVIGIRYHRDTLIMEGNSIHDNTEYGMTNTSLAHTVVDARNNWWGDASGPLHIITNPNGLGNRVSDYILYSPWKDCYNNCTSNVLFLPGIMGSRLYENTGIEDSELWVSSSDALQERMEMNNDGTSKYSIFTKNDTQRGSEFNETGIVDDAYGSNLYESFLEDLRDWKSEGLFTDYAFIPYDWRLSLEDIIMNGRVEGGNLSYVTENNDLSQSFIYQQLRDLQATSKSGKVTLVGHSNGGLVIKAFVQKLKDSGDPLYHQIDKIVLVAVPQTGTPDSVVSMLYGSKIGIAWLGVSAERSRSLISRMPTMYNLLPSEKLFDAINPPIEFVGNNIDPILTSRYGEKINTHQELREFLTGVDGRAQSDYNDTYNPAVLSSNLYDQSETVHQALDSFVPAPETEVIQIAGWGMYTISGLRITDNKECIFDSNQLIDGRPVCTENKDGVTIEDRVTLNGDATVLAPSALSMTGSSQVKNYWVDLRRSNDENNENIITEKKHKNIIEFDNLRFFLKSYIQNTGINYQFVSDTEPQQLVDLSYIKYKVHLPLHLTVSDSAGNKVGWDENAGSIVEDIKGAQYFEIGEVKTAFIPKDTSHSVRLVAYEKGSFTFTREELQGEQVVNETKFEAIPTLENTRVDITQATDTVPAQMKIDFDGDNQPETTLEASPSGVVTYENPVPLDNVPPETIINILGNKGLNDWYQSAVNVSFTTEAGASTEYSLDNGNNWTSSTTILTIDEEGVSKIFYRSTDAAGNVEVAKEQEIKIDTISPEGIISFDVATEKLKVTGRENDVTVTVNGTIYTLVDQAGNTTFITFASSKKKEKKSEDSYTLQSIQYGEEGPIIQKETRLTYKYKDERRRDEAKAFTSSLRTSNQKLVAHYLKKKDKTYIMDKTENDEEDPETCERRRVKTILPGLVVPYMETASGKINIKY